MALATLAPATHPQTRAATLNRTQAASRLGMNGPGVDKLVRAGLLTLPIKASAIADLQDRPRLQITAGEITVLRTDARTECDPLLYPMDQRQWMGFHVQHTDAELEASSLRWWRCDPHRVVDNELLVVTVATFPVALFRILEHVDSIVRPDEPRPRHKFSGELLGRVYPDMAQDLPLGTPGHLREMAKQIMNSRISVNSGGPIGYLEPDSHV